jgi:IS5 family transposase
MSEAQKVFCKNDIERYKRAVKKKKTDKNKIYSLHKPFRNCLNLAKNYIIV